MGLALVSSFFDRALTSAGRDDRRIFARLPFRRRRFAGGRRHWRFPYLPERRGEQRESVRLWRFVFRWKRVRGIRYGSALFLRAQAEFLIALGKAWSRLLVWRPIRRSARFARPPIGNNRRSVRIGRDHP